MISDTWKAVIALATLVCLCGLLVWGGYAWGTSTTEATWQARVAKRELDQRNALDAEVKRGNEFVAETIHDQLNQRDSYDQLEDKYATLAKATPLLVARANARAGEVSGASSAVPMDAGPASRAPEPAGPGVACGVGASVGVSVGLSLSAVRMWNGALAGADLPAGACGADAAAAEPEAACAQDSGVSVEDAWANHAWNARACAEDRLNHQRLIDFLQGRRTEPAGATP